ncbi:MAG: thioredoxin [Planctomycetaceae bacterium]|jgi:thioredoxin 1|nr:thioredoxin [Planctomycetaceae bacterium]
MSQVIEVTEQDFDVTVLKSDVPVLVDFWSASCGPCRLIVPVLEELAAENDGDVKIVKVNVMDNMNTAARYGVDMLPTLMIFNGGSVVERMVGVVAKSRLQDALDELE